MAKRIHISLIGEQPIVALLPVCADAPDEIILLQTGADERHVINIKRALALAAPHLPISLHPAQLPLYDPAVAYELSAQLFRQLRAHQVTVNITDGSKLTAAAVTMAAHDNGADVLYVRSYAEGTMIHWSAEEILEKPLQIRIPLDIRFACYGFSLTVRPSDWQARHVHAAMVLARAAAAPNNTPFMHEIKEFGKKTTGTLKLAKREYASVAAVITALHRDHIWCVKEDDVQYVLTHMGDDTRLFLAGGWLELYVFTICQQLQPDDVVLNALVECEEALAAERVTGENTGALNELDVLCCRNEELLICSCKSGLGLQTSRNINAAIYELDSVAGPTRVGAYCHKVLVTTCHNITAKTMDRARHSNITLISGGDLPRVAEIVEGLLAS